MSDVADDAIGSLSREVDRAELLARLAAWDWDQPRDAVSVNDIG
jgi:hypothetical protein